MRNPLTLEERVEIPRLIDHDLMQQMEYLYSVADGAYTVVREHELNESIVVYRIERHIKNVLRTILILSTYYDDCYFGQATPSDFKFIGDELLTVHRKRKGSLTFSNEFQESLTTHEPVIYTVLHNLTKNALRINEKGSVDINITPFFGCIPNAVYQPPESRLSGGFVKFTVHDDGPGFPTDRPLADFLEDGVSTRGPAYGFGLYFVKLAAKFLRAPIAIESKPGDTTVSLYHPVKLGN